MRKIVIVSSNNNPDYLHYAKYQEIAWNKLGWQLCIMITSDVDPKDLELPSYFQPTDKPETIIVKLPDIPELRTETIAQAGRLYAANYLADDDLIMTCDMDLIPLSDYWHPDPEKITVYGHDLTWRSFYPMGYIAMSGMNWKKYMRLTLNTYVDILGDVNDKSIPHSPKSKEWEEWWNYDWSLITQRLSPYKHLIEFKDRGQIDIAGATLAKGRIDRYNWDVTQNQPEPFIDMHCENNNVKHPVKLEPFLKVFNKFYQ